MIEKSILWGRAPQVCPTQFKGANPGQGPAGVKQLKKQNFLLARVSLWQCLFFYWRGARNIAKEAKNKLSPDPKTRSLPEMFLMCPRAPAPPLCRQLKNNSTVPN